MLKRFPLVPIALIFLVTGCGNLIPAASPDEDTDPGAAIPGETGESASTQPDSDGGGDTDNEAGFRLYPVAINRESAGNGFDTYTVQIGIENPGDQSFSTGIYLGDILLNTAEGYQYHLGNDAQTENYLDVWDPCVLPPGLKKASDSYTFSIGETLHPSTLEIENYGSVALDSTDAIFPTDKPESAFLDFPKTIESGDVTLEILGNPRLEQGDWEWKMGLETRLYNANPAESAGGCLSLTVIDRNGTCHASQQYCGLPDTGPLQTSQDYVWMEPTVLDNDITAVQDLFQGAKIYVSYNNGEWDGVFNLDLP